MISDASLTNMLLILVACAVIGAVLIAFLPPDDEAMRNSAVMFVGLLFNPEADGSHD